MGKQGSYKYSADLKGKVNIEAGMENGTIWNIEL